MISRLYRYYSKPLLWAVCLSFPFLYHAAETIPSNNDIETWLPRESPVRATYNDFKREFGAEEVILVGLPGCGEDDALVESLATRLDRLPGIRRAWTPARLRAAMREMQVPDAEIDAHLRGLAVSDDGKLIGLVALLSDEGLQDRAGTVGQVRDALDYCQLNEDRVCLAGAPVVVSELDRLGNRASNKKLFVITLLISLGLLHWSIRQWKLSLSLLGLTIWAINATMALIKLAGGEMNFILGALSVMVMVFTLAIAIHFLHYYRSSLDKPDPLGAALAMAWKPCALATLTTAIGLVSLAMSDIGPVCQFGYGAALGSLVAMFTGLGLTPAVITVCPPLSRTSNEAGRGIAWTSYWISNHPAKVTVATLALVAVTSVGVLRLKSRIDPLDFLPADGRVRSDVARIEEHLTNANSIEAVVDFGGRDLAFVDQLSEVRRLDERIAAHPAVRHTTSVASFFPREMPQGFAAAALLSKARERQGESDFVSAGGNLWRISARISAGAGERTRVLRELEELTAGAPIAFTGVAPLLEHAQHTIFRGFWESFSTAFLIITGVMIVSLRSLKTGLLAMVPNLTPICIVFGILGWIDFPVDIGMMMTGSIALGIAVDGTFHFLVRFEEHRRRVRDRRKASMLALLQTGTPIASAAVIASIGMLALALSNFSPTARFGYLMATLLLTALLGDLVLLPALLAIRGRRRRRRRRPDAPHLARHGSRALRRERAGASL
ncbi:MAG: MMPL family transporter [Planctomycetales bacterium]